MTNDIHELSINELDTVNGGTGSLSDVMTYVSAYTAALGTVRERYLPNPGEFPGCPKPPNGQHG
jgi:bacteriocin-like protein